MNNKKANKKLKNLMEQKMDFIADNTLMRYVIKILDGLSHF